MAKFLVVAHQTAASPELVAKLKEIQATDAQAEFVLLVPATSTAHLLTWVDGEKEQIAQRRASEATSALRRAGLSVTHTIIGDADPLKAIEKEQRESGGQYAMTIISMLPPGLSRWFKRDLPHQVRSRLGIPVTAVIAGQMMSRATSSSAAVEAGEQTGTEPLSLQQFAQRQGQNVLCLDGNIGKMQEVLYDYVTRTPLWVGILSQPRQLRPLLLPARAVRAEDNHLLIELTRQQIIGQPPVNVGEGFSSLSEEERLCRYFGLPFDEVRDTRVLRAGQQYPEQDILASERTG